MTLSLRAGAPWIGALLLAATPAAAREGVSPAEPGAAASVVDAALVNDADAATEVTTSDGAPVGDDGATEGEERSGGDLEAYWRQRLARARQRIELARTRKTEAEAEYARARHDSYPRGDAFEEIKQRLAAAERELRDAEAALPRLVEQARRAGVSPGVLREYWDEEGADEPS